MFLQHHLSKRIRGNLLGRFSIRICKLWTKDNTVCSSKEKGTKSSNQNNENPLLKFNTYNSYCINSRHMKHCFSFIFDKISTWHRKRNSNWSCELLCADTYHNIIQVLVYLSKSCVVLFYTLSHVSYSSCVLWLVLSISRTRRMT